MNFPISKITILFLLLILSLVGCTQPKPALAPAPTTVKAIPTPTVTETVIPSRTSTTPEVQALVKNTIEFYRNGKTYEVVVGYDAGDIFFNVTPQPLLPKKYGEVGRGFAKLNGYGDFDKDGETEFYATVIYCGASCGQEVRLYKYDPGKDEYIVADKFSNKFGIDQYKELDQDGNPELIVNGLGYCLYGNAGDKTFSVVSVLRYEKGKIIDVSKEFPDVIVADAEHNLSFSKSDGDHQGVAELLLASYIYDMHLLDKLEEAKPNFDKVCNEVVKPREEKAGRNFDCPAFWSEVQADIQKYEQAKSHQ